MGRAQETQYKGVIVHGHWVSTYVKDAVSISCSEWPSSTSSPDGTASDPMHTPILGTHDSLCCSSANSFEFPVALLSSPMQAGTAAIPPSPTENFSTETQTSVPYPKSKGNWSTNAFSQGLKENLGQSKKFHLHFPRYQTVPEMGLTANQDLPYRPYNAKVRPQSPEPDYSTRSTRHHCSLTNYSVH